MRYALSVDAHIVLRSIQSSHNELPAMLCTWLVGWLYDNTFPNGQYNVHKKGDNYKSRIKYFLSRCVCISFHMWHCIPLIFYHDFFLNHLQKLSN